jgi:anthranilate synthase/aminodeoxychorismate synthase-like glutamine amidotransferase
VRRLLLLDNYDSFTYNLAQALAVLGAEVTVARSDHIAVDEVLRPELAGLVLSPGPGRPEEAGCCPAALLALDAAGSPLPVLGVCLGHQVMAMVYGGQVVRAARPIHGEIWDVLPAGPHGRWAEHGDAGSAADAVDDPLWAGVPAPLRATRYHSLVAERQSLPACLEVTAQSPSGEVMALRHRHRPRWGVQFHPESVGSPDGPLLLRNFLRLCERPRAA